MNVRFAIHSEWTKFRTARSTTWTACAMGLVIPVLAVIVAATSSLSEDDTVVGGSLTGTVIALIVAGTIGGVVITSEYRTGSIGSTLAAHPRRSRVLAAKASVVAIVTFVITVAASIAGFGLGWLMLDRNDHPTGDLFPAVLGIGATVSVVSVLGLALGTVIRHSAGTVGAVVAILLLPDMLGPLFGDFERWVGGASPVGVVEKFTQTTDASPDTVGSIGAWPALAIVAGGVMLIMVASAHVFRSRDA